MFKLLLLTLISVVSYLNAADTTSRLVDGIVQFAIATVNDERAWDSAHKQKLIDKYTEQGVPVTVVDYTPTQTEIAISTNCGKFSNYTDWKESNTKRGLYKKFRDLKAEYDIAVDLNDTDKIKELKQRYFYLKQVYQTLP